jgi:hypothetical protein
MERIVANLLIRAHLEDGVAGRTNRSQMNVAVRGAE